MKSYSQAPLPFQGQKRRFVKQFKECLNAIPDSAIVVDLFGGSGLLSHTVKSNRPDIKVVYNDFDNYSLRLQNVTNTNRVISKIREVVKGIPNKSRIDGKAKEKVVSIIKAEKVFVDSITLSANILFSGNWATTVDELCNSTMYNRVVLSEYRADGYLDGVDVVSMDYRALFDEYKDSNVIFIVDPPYLSTDVSTYTSCWKLSEYLDVLDCLQDSNYYYFTSHKSQVEELCRWISSRSNYNNPFHGAEKRTVSGTVNYSSNYQDIMYIKYINNE